MKTSTKTVLVSALALACAGGVYAQSAGGSAGGTGGGTRGGNAPEGNSLNQPTVQPGTAGAGDDGQTMRSRRNSGGYGNPGTTGAGSGRSTVSPGMNQQNPSGTTGNYSPQQENQDYRGHQQ